MKARPKPKKISFIKLTTATNKNDSKTNNKKMNKTKKANTVLNSNILFINSPRNNLVSSKTKYNEKLLNKIKEFSLESHILNQVIQKSTTNSKKKNNIRYYKENESDNKSDFNDLKFNSLDNNINKGVKKIKNRNYTKFNTERQVNPFNQNVIINTTTSNELNSNKTNRRDKNIVIKSVSKRKIKENLENNLKLSHKNILKKRNMRNTSQNNKIIETRKNNNRKESNDEIIINNTEDNDNYDIHKSYNLTSKNSFNFYYPDIQFLSSKNMLEKKRRNMKINYEIKEENEKNIINSEHKRYNKNNNKFEFNFKKSKTNCNSKTKNWRQSKKNNYEIKTENINDLKVNKKIKKINRKENTFTSLNKKRKRIIFSETNKDALSFCEYKGLYSPDTYSFEKGKIFSNKTEEKNKYLILNRYRIVKNKKFDGIDHYIFEKENTKLIENMKNLNLYNLQRNGNSFYNKKRIYENKKKSPINNKIFEQNSYNHKKISFLNSPNVRSSYNKIKRNEFSYNSSFKKYDNFKFLKLQKHRDNSASNSKSRSRPKSRPKSNLNKLKNSSKYNNKLSKLLLSIKTNWGNSLKIGINNIKLIDKNNKNIPIKTSNFDITKPYLTKYIKGEVKKLTIEYESNYALKNIVISNGFNDTGIKYLLVENDRGKLLWKGVIPKANLINIKSFYISMDNTDINKRKLVCSKTLNLNKIENNNSNINNLKHLNNNNTLMSSRIDETLDNLNKNYVLCDSLKIKLLDNYGNKDYIGLSGIQLYDNNNKLINIVENKKDIKINETIINLKEKKILYNLFNNKNDTINPKYMFLTTNINAFINIEFKQCLKISKIIFYNYNNNIYKDCATKVIFIDFYINNKKQNIMNKSIYLYMPPGEEKIDYGQILIYPFNESSSFVNKIRDNLSQINSSHKNNKIIYNDEYQYYCPSFPFGFILKIEMISNYGNKSYIGIENLQIFNEENKEIELFQSSNKNKTNDDYNNIHPKIYTMPEGNQIKSKAKPLILSKLYNFNSVNNDLGENRVYFIFNQCIGISKICIYNYEKYLEITAKHIKILLDDNIIFEGDLKNVEINNIYFCDKKYFNNKNEKKKMSDKKNNLSHEFGIKLNEFKKNIGNKINLERYIEYEGKNGTKILKLSE